MKTKEAHSIILNNLYKKYEELESDRKEFTWDGPSDWEIWTSSVPKIVFLLKESRQGFHPSKIDQPNETKFSKNLSRWSFAISNLFSKNLTVDFPDDDLLPDTMNHLCIVEVKKLNEEKPKSDPSEILEYAKNDKEFLKQQIDILEPDIVVCCGNIDWYDTIYEGNYEFEEKLSVIDNKSCWLVDNRLVIDFVHPTTWQPWIDPNERDYQLFDTLVRLLSEENVQNHILQLKIN